MVILTQDRREIITIGDFDSIHLGDGHGGKIYFQHGETVRLIGEYQSNYLAQAVLIQLYETFGLSPKYAMPSIGQAKHLSSTSGVL